MVHFLVWGSRMSKATSKDLTMNGSDSIRYFSLTLVGSNGRERERERERLFFGQGLRRVLLAEMALRERLFCGRDLGCCG